MDMNERVLPVDRFIAVYNGLFALVWCLHWGYAAYAPWIAAAHAGAATLGHLLGRAPKGMSRPMQLLRELYPLLMVGAFWFEIDVFRAAAPFETYDGIVASLDLMVFGEHLHRIWLPNMHQLWFSELLHAMYFLYLPLVFIPPLVVALQGRDSVARDMTFRLTVTYLTCFLVFLVFPVDGPHFTWEPFVGPHTEGFFYQLVQASQSAGDSRGCAFPSSHVAGAVTIAYLAWLWLPRWVAVLLTLEAAGVFCATVYSQNHYAVDSVAGVAWALAFQIGMIPALQRAFGEARSEVPVPLLPDGTRTRPRVHKREGDP